MVKEGEYLGPSFRLNKRNAPNREVRMTLMPGAPIPSATPPPRIKTLLDCRLA